ncbi:MAG: protoheme IX farnesyltransferase [Saprospirales bacterium]|nr:protoheme IX farnesyltransferase [Saprospirales bacterium]MBK8921337.1 protoheme IX farnesyltransferase [Saprospirales bacterium]
MERNAAQQITTWGSITQAITDFGLLVKFKLTLMVLFSALISYAIAGGGQVTAFGMTVLAMGGFLVTGAANTLNQVLERDYDRLMTRTANRPVAAGRMSVSTAVLWAGMMALFGITLLSLFNPLTGFLGMLSLISYAFIYTPLKRSTPLAVVVGAVPGALPLVIGCTAFDGVMTTTAWMLFTIQFLWQFPHFWAVAWLADEDYKKAGFYMLPSRNGEQNETTGLLSFFFCLLMIVNAGIGYWTGFSGAFASVVLAGINAYFAFRSWQLYRECSRGAARRQMFASFLHLPLSLMVILLDKI